ncbi:ISKra4 family transposase [Candidatus Uhrbacteria bacterium]|nr:ISKra4 family transposase [Candidatus Uhrbacteria bacterium]
MQRVYEQPVEEKVKPPKLSGRIAVVTTQEASQMNDTPQLAETLDTMAAQLSTLLNETIPDPADMSEMERVSREITVMLGRKVLESWLNQSEDEEPAREIRDENGEIADYVGKREGTMYTVLGKVKVKRAYYLYRARSGGIYPLDQRIGWRPNAMSAELERLSGLVGAQVPFGKGSALFEALTLVSLSDHALDKATQAYGQEVVARENDWQAQAANQDAMLSRQRTARRPLRLYGSLDGTSVHTRGEPTDDPAQPDPWRELKIGAWFTTASHPPRTPEEEWTIRAQDITYYTDICPATEFGELLWATGVQQNAHLARELIILGDGAAWIWRLVDQHFPHAIQIVDWFHATEYLPPVAAVAFKDPTQRQAWLAQVRTDLWEGRIDAVIAACTLHLNPARENDPAQAAVTYFSNNRHRMNYPTYRAQGYQIGSGSIESAAKQIGAQRMKVPGARWNLSSARHVAKARAAFLSGQWDALATRRRKFVRIA